MGIHTKRTFLYLKYFFQRSQKNPLDAPFRLPEHGGDLFDAEAVPVAKPQDFLLLPGESLGRGFFQEKHPSLASRQTAGKGLP